MDVWSAGSLFYGDVGVYGSVKISRFTQKIPNHSKMEPRKKKGDIML